MVCRDLSHSDCPHGKGLYRRGKPGLGRASVSAVVSSSARQKGLIAGLIAPAMKLDPGRAFRRSARRSFVH